MESKKIKRSLSMEVLYESYSTNTNTEELNNDYANIINNLNDIKLNYSNKDTLLEILKKTSYIEKKMEYIDKFNIRLDYLQKTIDKYISEKDYIIESLQEEVQYLKNELKELNHEKKSDDKKINDYFY